MSESTENWQDKAEQNTEKWGVQPPEDVVLAIAEELAEITEEIFSQTDISTNDHTREERYLLYLLTEIGVLGEEVQYTLEDSYEDENGDPLPKEERPRILGDLEHSEPVMDEVDDLGPLIFQLRESVEEYSDW